MMKIRLSISCALLLASVACAGFAMADPTATHPTVLHAARLLEVDTGRVIAPAEILIDGERIAAVGSSVPHPSGATLIDLGDTTLLPGLIDVHVHLFLHPGAEDLQTVEESVPQRTRAALRRGNSS
jgi:imidazolonepropionase-like amidohydrolase